MPFAYPIYDFSARTLRAVCALTGICLLLLQLVGPALARSGDSTWIEICADGAAVWVEIELEADAGDPTAPCPKCADCTLCALTTTAPLPDLPEMARSRLVQPAPQECRDLPNSHSWQNLWPETRGPPRAAQTKTERTPRVSMASIQTTGGAPWS
ncbi:MAG: hypothetical protein AB3N15_15530 [Paracoccaceae bacterium]